MAVQDWIAAGTAAADAALETTGNIIVVATKLARGEQVVIKVYGPAGDVETSVNHNVDIILTPLNNSAQLLGPCKYHAYKSITAVSLGVGYYE